MKNKIETTSAPAAIGPYSQGVCVSDMIFVSGQLPVDPSTGEMPQTIEEQTKQSLTNLENILTAAGSSLDMVCKTTVFLNDMNDFAKMNAVYEQVFANTIFPARSAVEVSRLPKDALVEIEAIAYKK